MATTSPDGLYSPDEDTPVDFIADWAASMSSVQTALTNRSSKSGTTAQRTAATGVREGTLWWDTDDNALYRYTGTSWIRLGVGDSGLITDRSNILNVFSGFTASGFAARRTSGLVTITASISGSFNSTGSFSIGTLAAGWRPGGEQVVGSAMYSSSGYIPGVVAISTSGNITLWKETSGNRGAARFSATFPVP